MFVLTVASLKGGVGKTAIAVFLSRALLIQGKRVLAVDLDHNNNLTDYYLRHVEPEQLEQANVCHVFTGQRTIQECIFPSPYGVDVLPCTLSLSRSVVELAEESGAMVRLSALLKLLEYDAVVIDTPPAMGLELTAALYAASTVLVPMTYNRWTTQGWLLIRQEVQRVARSFGHEPAVYALPSMVNEAQLEKLKQLEVDNLTKTAILKWAPIHRACETGSILREDSIAGMAFAALAKEVLS